MTKKSKYLPIGNVVDFGKGESITLDNVQLKNFLDALKKHGKKHLGDLSEEEIMAAQKIKYGEDGHLPRFQIYRFAPSEKAPEFIKGNLAIKLEE